jgi:hypothetical protein
LAAVQAFPTDIRETRKIRRTAVAVVKAGKIAAVVAG